MQGPQAGLVPNLPTSPERTVQVLLLGWQPNDALLSRKCKQKGTVSLILYEYECESFRGKPPDSRYFEENLVRLPFGGVEAGGCLF